MSRFIELRLLSNALVIAAALLVPLQPAWAQTAPSPAPEAQRANWLPAPKGPINLFLRAYLPDESLVHQTWVPPAVTRLP